MLYRNLVALRDLIDALPSDAATRPVLPVLQTIPSPLSPLAVAGEVVREAAREAGEARWVEMPFLHNITPDIRAIWDLNDFDPAGPNDEPNLNLAVMGLILATNIESTVGAHAWSLVEYSLDRLGFTNIVHHYFEDAQKVNHPAMAFGISCETVGGKHVVAAVYRGSSSFEDFISDAKAEPGGFHEAGINATNELRAYCASQRLTKEDTILFIVGHSYGASCASLVGINSTDLAERDSIFCYSYATPNYIRNGLTGEGMKMFSFNSNEDVVPQVPVGPNLDKTGVSINYDRLDLKLHHPDQYARFLRLYEHYRDSDYDSDTDFLPDAYTFKPYVPRPVDNPIIRNHMPYTYMPLLLCGLSDEDVESYIVEVPGEEGGAPDWTMYKGEVYRLPLTGSGLFGWASSDDAVVSIDENGMMTAMTEGDALLTLTAPSGAKSTLKLHVSEV